MTELRLVPLDEARREHAEAEAAWRGLSNRESALARGRDEDGLLLDEIDAGLARQALAAQRPQAAARLADARETLRRARVEHTRSLLPKAVESALASGGAVESARAELERVWTQLVSCGWRLARAVEAERSAVRAVAAAVASTLPGDDDRVRLRQDVRHQTPVAIGDDGRPTAWAARPLPGLFGSPKDSDDPRSDRFWTNLGGIVRDEGAVRRHMRPELVSMIDNAEVGR